VKNDEVRQDRPFIVSSRMPSSPSGRRLTTAPPPASSAPGHLAGGTTPSQSGGCSTEATVGHPTVC